MLITGQQARFLTGDDHERHTDLDHRIRSRCVCTQNTNMEPRRTRQTQSQWLAARVKHIAMLAGAPLIALIAVIAFPVRRDCSSRLDGIGIAERVKDIALFLRRAVRGLPTQSPSR